MFLVAGLLAISAVIGDPKRPTGHGAASAVPTLAGDWYGEIVPGGGRTIPLVLHITGVPGALKAAIDSPSQGAKNLTVNTVEQKSRELRLSLTALSAGYTATASDDGKRLEGVWSQGGASIALVFTRGTSASAASVKRPQTPTQPFPYRVEEVSYENAPGHAHLAGTLTLPDRVAPVPAVLLITGSGLQDRDETLFGHKPFLVWADALTRRGIAVLRVDDRQTGGSTGEIRSATTEDFAGDAQAGVAYLASRREVDPLRIGLLGHSEGGVVAPLVASRDPRVAFLVLLAAPGEPGETLLLSQKRLLEERSGAGTAVVDRSVGTLRQLYDAVKGAPDQLSAERRFAAAWRKIVGEDERLAGTPPPADLQELTLPWMRWFLSYDPQSGFRNVRCPVLALAGSKDLQVPAAENLAGIKVALRGIPDVTTMTLPGLNHLFQTAPTGDPSEYGEIEETVAPVVLKTVGDWIFAHTAAGKHPAAG